MLMKTPSYIIRDGRKLETATGSEEIPMPREATAKKRSFSSYTPSKDKLKSKAAGGGSYDNYIKPQFKKYKIKDGKNLIRVLPPTWEDADYHALDIYVNYGIGPDNSSYLSLSKHGKGKDPISEARNEANREGDDEYAKKLQPRGRRLMWVIDRMDEDEGPQILDAPVTLDKHFANLSCGDEDEDSGGIINFVDPTEGRDIRFYREGKGKNAKYEGSQVRFLKPSPLSDDDEQLKEWMEFVKENPLPDCLQFYSYDHIAQMFDGSAPSRDDDDEEEKPRKRTRSTNDDDDADVKPRKKAKPPVDDDEDEDPPPRKKAKPPFDDDDNESDADSDGDDDDTDDDDDAKPVRARSKRAADDDDDEDEDEPKKGGSLREKIRSRRRSANEDEDE